MTDIRSLKRALALVVTPLSFALAAACGSNSTPTSGGSSNVSACGDHGCPEPDSGMDSGTCWGDKCPEMDSGTMDGGMADSGMETDSGNQTDGGTPMDSGSTCDTGTCGTDAAPPPEVDSGCVTDGGETQTLSDGQVFEILLTANKGEIVEAKVALSKSTNTDVRSFANRMVSDHQTAYDQEVALSARLGVMPTPSDVSRMLQEDALKEIAKLSAPDCSIDSTYSHDQVKDHEDVLSIIDTKLIPSAKDPALKAHVVAVRATVATHLELAKALDAKINGH